MSRPLDFLGIGTAKAGTTSLFQHLRRHPGAWLPPQKEIPYFTQPSWKSDWDSFHGRYFAEAPADALIGKITPRYMVFPQVARRVAEVMPDTKVLVLLRDPVDRAYSDWKMRRRVGHESRSFEEAVKQQMRTRSELTAPDVHLSPLDLYLVRGEYGRLIEPWLDHFPREQILVEFTETLRRRPGLVAKRLFDFLELPGADSWEQQFERRYHKGGDKERFPGLIQSLARNRVARSFWRLAPFDRRIEWLRWLNANVRYRRSKSTPPSEVRARLVEYYRADVHRLTGLLGQPTPWSRYFVD